MIRRFLLATTLAAGLVACGASSTPVAPTPTPPPVPACQANNTGTVTFGNTSRQTTQTILWDGLVRATLAPGFDSAPFDTAAGVAHRLEVRIANTTALACAVSTPIPIQCASNRYTCAFPQ